MENDDKMGSKAYAWFDHTFMLFGSLAKSFAPGVPTEDWQGWADQWFDWSHTKAKELVEEAYHDKETKEEVPSPPEEKEEEGVINANQAKRFYAIAYNEGGYTQEGIKRLLKKHDLVSAYKISPKKYEHFCTIARSKSLAEEFNKGVS